MIWRAITACLLVLSLSLNATGEEKINRFDVDIIVETNGDIIVTETINVTSEGRSIRRGIFRDLPRYYSDDAREGDKLAYSYDVMRVRRDGQRESYSREVDGNAYRIRIGSEDVFLQNGEHEYVIRYRTKNQVRYFENHDELYWNVTGNYWQFPIDSARVNITLPDGAKITDQVGYTGDFGESEAAYSFQRNDKDYVFRTTEPLGAYQGLTVSLSFEKGLIAPPSLSDKAGVWWMRNGALSLLIVSFLGVFTFLMMSFHKVGRDPPKPPVFPLYEPPKGYSPAAAHHVYYRGMRGHSALIASFIHMGVKGLVNIDASDKKKTKLSWVKTAASEALSEEEGLLEAKLFSRNEDLTLGGKYSASFTSAYMAFRKALSDRYGTSYFRWNIGYVIGAAFLTIIGIVVSLTQAINWSGWLTLLLLGLAGLNGLFMYLMPAPTPRGQKVRTEIAGFRLYLETAEKLALNAVKVGSDAPPPMTKARYEKFLPYAVALNVEKPWTKHFEKTLPAEAAHYNPGWSNMGNRGYGDIGGMNEAIYSSISSGVSSALPQSSSSSGGSSGGGFSGGGGGGGGGGGW